MGIGFKFFLAATVICFCTVYAAEEQPVEYRGDSFQVSFSETGELKGVNLEGNVRIIYQDMVITCEKAFLDRISGTIQAEGNVVVESEKGKFQADFMNYDLSSLSGVLSGVRFSVEPFYGRAEKLQRQKDIFILEKGYLTSCNLEKPHYRLSFERVEFKTKTYIKTQPLRVILGEKFTVFYLPKWTYNLKTKRPPVNASPGYRTGLGHFLGIRFNQSLTKDNDLVLSEQLYLQSKGLGGGFLLSSEEKKLRLEALALRKWKQEQPDYGAVAEYRSSFQNQWGSSNFILDWRWMRSNDFFSDYFRKDFFEKSRTYNYLACNQFLGKSFVSMQVRERAREEILSVEHFPSLRWLVPDTPVGTLPVYLGNDFQAGHFRIDEEESVRIINKSTLSFKRNLGAFSIRPYLTLSAIKYYGSEFDVFRHPMEVGVNVSAVLARAGEKNYYQKLLVSFLVLDRFFLTPEAGIPVYDDNELLSSGRFTGFNVEWALWRKDHYLGQASLLSLYDTTRQFFADTCFSYQFQPTDKISLWGTNIWNFSAGSYRFGTNDISFQGGSLKYTIGVRHKVNEVMGLENWVEQNIGRLWTYRAGFFYDFRKEHLVSQSYQLWRKLHCWTAHVSLWFDRRETSFFLSFYPSIFSQPERLREKIEKWK